MERDEDEAESSEEARRSRTGVAAWRATKRLLLQVAGRLMWRPGEGKLVFADPPSAAVPAGYRVVRNG